MLNILKTAWVKATCSPKFLGWKRNNTVQHCGPKANDLFDHYTDYWSSLHLSNEWNSQTYELRKRMYTVSQVHREMMRNWSLAWPLMIPSNLIVTLTYTCACKPNLWDATLFLDSLFTLSLCSCNILQIIISPPSPERERQGPEDSTDTCMCAGKTDELTCMDHGKYLSSDRKAKPGTNGRC